MRKIGYSLGQWMIDNYGQDAIDKYWSNKNNVNPFDISKNSSRSKVYIKCHNGAHDDYLMSAHGIKDLRVCSVCDGKKVLRGFNDVATLRPELIDYFVDKNDAYTYGHCSDRVVAVRCVNCGATWNIKVSDFVRRTHICSVCGDGNSYANKFIYCVLQQLLDGSDASFETEKVFDWSKNVMCPVTNTVGNKRYDFYVQHTDDIIIEAHGIQHYKDGQGAFNKVLTLTDQQDNDAYKRSLALFNGIKDVCYVEIDCRQSSLAYIKNSIMNSELPNLLNFSENDINWKLCEMAALKSLVVDVAELWNDGVCDIDIIANKLRVCSVTVRSYLKKADSLGLCEFDTDYTKPIICLENQYVFKSIKLCSEVSVDVFGFYIKRTTLNEHLRGANKSTHGLHFKQITPQEFRRILLDEPWRVFQKNKK
jgi:hypothetical protein